MSGAVAHSVSEYLVIGLDTLRRRWLVFFLPILLAVPIAYGVTKLMPTKYTAKSLILLQSTSRTDTPYSRQSIMEHVAAIEAWLKSDHVMRELLPQIIDIEYPSDPKEATALLDVARSSIGFTPLGGSALEISFEAQKPDGLGKKLEVILAKIMESLEGPGQGIFNASQFALLKRAEAMRQSRSALDQAIVEIGAPQDEMELRLRTLQELSSLPRPADPLDAAERAKQKTDLEETVSSDPGVVARLLGLYSTFREAADEHDTLKERLSSQGSNYVGIFDAASSIVLVGRPQDPVFGDNAKRKIAMAIVFLGCVIAFGLVALMELFFPGMRTRREFEERSGLPVISRLQKLPRASR